MNEEEKMIFAWKYDFFVLHLHTKHLNNKIMTTTISRIPASFRFQSTLMDELKSKAKASNRSLNNYVENLLLGILHPEDKEKKETFEDTDEESLLSKEDFLAKVERSIIDIRKGNKYGMQDGESLDAFMDRMEREGNV